MFLLSAEVSALPSFARQAGEPCTACHVQAFGPGLTPEGRNFKLNGYRETDKANAKIIPLSAMVRGSFTHTQRDQPDGVAIRFGPNNNATIDEASIFYGGLIAPKVGIRNYDGFGRNAVGNDTVYLNGWLAF